ncbi:Ras family protein, partial [Ostertagia ostertagi]
FRSITKQYFRKADGVLLLFDVTSEQSFLNVRNWIESVRNGVEDSTVLALVGNKVDLFGSDSSRNSVYKAGKKLADQYFRKADGVLLLFDVTSEQSFLNVRNWIESVRNGVEDSTVLALVGNKVDLFGSDSSRNSVYKAGKKLADDGIQPVEKLKE